MSENGFLSEDLRSFLRDPMGNADKGADLLKNGKISLATRIILNNACNMFSLDDTFLQSLDNFLSTNKPSDFRTKFNEIDSLIKNDDKIEKEHQKQGLLLGLLLIKLDLLERANYNGREIYNETKNIINSSFNSIFDNCGKNPPFIDSLLVNYISLSLRLEGEPSQYFAKTFLKTYKDKFKTVPEIGDFGNIYCVLLSSNQPRIEPFWGIKLSPSTEQIKSNLDFLEQNINPEDLIAYSSNSGHKLQQKTERKSTLFEERVNGTESTNIARGNLNYISQLVGYYIVNNYDNELNNEKNLNRFNSHFSRIFNDLINYVSINKDNPEIIKEANYMLNCPIYVKTGYLTTLADFVKCELRFNRNITSERRDILQKFTKVMGIEADQNLNIPGLKLMTSEEAIAQYGTAIEKEVKINPEFMLKTYGASSIAPEELNDLIKKKEPLKEITIDEKVIVPLLKNNFSDFSDLTLTPKALCFAKSFANNDKNTNELSLNRVKIKTNNEKIDENTFEVMCDSNFKSFEGAVFTGEFSDENKKKVLETIGFYDVVKPAIEKNGTNYIVEIKNYINDVSSFFEKYGLENIVHENVLEKLEDIKTNFGKNNEKRGFFVKRQKKNEIIKNFNKFKEIDAITGEVQKSLGVS